MDKIKIVSLNVHGLRNGLKRRKVFKLLKDQRADICMLQESHGTAEVEALWNSEWGLRGLFAHGSSDARGVTTFVNKQIRYKITQVQSDKEGRFLVIKLDLDEFSVCIANIYAPNTDNPLFFTNVTNKIKDMEATFTIMGGDFNIALDAKMDRHEGVQYHKKAHRELLNYIEGEQLIDIWRIKNPETKRFIWHRKEGQVIKWSRIDYYLLSEQLHNVVTECDIKPGLWTDHSMTTLAFEMNNQR